MPLYVTVAIVLYREEDIFKEDCDMASLHCLLSQVCYIFCFLESCRSFIECYSFRQLPEDLPFEYLLRKAAKLYEIHPPDEIELEVQQLIIRE